MLAVLSQGRPECESDGLRGLQVRKLHSPQPGAPWLLAYASAIADRVLVKRLISFQKILAHRALYNPSARRVLQAILVCSQISPGERWSARGFYYPPCRRSYQDRVRSVAHSMKVARRPEFPKWRMRERLRSSPGHRMCVALAPKRSWAWWEGGSSACAPRARPIEVYCSSGAIYKSALQTQYWYPTVRCMEEVGPARPRPLPGFLDAINGHQRATGRLRGRRWGWW